MKHSDKPINSKKKASRRPAQNRRKKAVREDFSQAKVPIVKGVTDKV